MTGWEERVASARARYEDGAARLPDDRDERQRQLTRMGNAAWAAGLALLMLGRREEAREWLIRAAETYRESWPEAPPGSWGRPIGAMKSRLIAGDLEGAQADAKWALDARAAEAESPIGRYAATLAELVLEHDDEAAGLAESLRDAESIPPAVTDSLVALAARDAAAYEAAIRALVADFETRDAYLEDTPVADTVLALQALAAERWIVIALDSSVLPG
jgi:tetratricopeptide (TPR) repeat protein